MIGKTRGGNPEHQGECVSGEYVGDDTEDNDQRYAHQHHGGDHDGFGKWRMIQILGVPVGRADPESFSEVRPAHG